MWQAKRETIDKNRIQQISLFANQQPVTYGEVIQLWQSDRSFREFFISVLAEAEMPAYFWETPPISQSSCDRAFEFVLIDSDSLADIKPDPRDFQEYFDSATGEVVTFPNLSKDALLVVPCPIKNIPACTHIAAFVRDAPESQQHSLWQTVGQTIEANLSEQPLWVSTSGLDVSWLHVRLDSQPKNYEFEPYQAT